MSRAERQAKILEIIESRPVETQQELTALLKEAGFDATQATVSRDIQDLGLEKTNSNGKRYRKPLDPKFIKLKTLFHQSVLSVDGVGNLIVIKTLSGAANSACALIDKLEQPDIMGTIAGDDSILVIVRQAERLHATIELFRSLMV